MSAIEGKAAILGAGYLAGPARRHPGSRRGDQFGGRVCRSSILADISVFFGADGDDEPSPEYKFDHLNAHLAELCYNVGLTNAKIHALAKQARAAIERARKSKCYTGRHKKPSKL
jgi:hypothetical protein